MAYPAPYQQQQQQQQQVPYNQGGYQQQPTRFQPYNNNGYGNGGGGGGGGNNNYNRQSSNAPVVGQCQTCGQPVREYVCQNNNKGNLGRKYTRCDTKGCKSFQWASGPQQQQPQQQQQYNAAPPFVQGAVISTQLGYDHNPNGAMNSNEAQGYQTALLEQLLAAVSKIVTTLENGFPPRVASPNNNNNNDDSIVDDDM